MFNYMARTLLCSFYNICYIIETLPQLYEVEINILFL